LLASRLDEGHGETVFDLGVEENGDPMNFSLAEWKSSLDRIQNIANGLKADCKVLISRGVEEEAKTDENGDGGIIVEGKKSQAQIPCTGKISIRRRPNSIDDVIEVRIAVVGNVDAGKSTMLGVLVKGGLDDGRGKARVNLFRHKHEIESGRTGSVGMEIMGFDSKGEIVSSEVPGRKLSWEEVGNRSVCIMLSLSSDC